MTTVRRAAGMSDMQSFCAGVIACAPTILGYWSIGFAAGAIGAISGYSLNEIALLAALLYAGSAQFMFYSLHASGAGPWAIVLTVLLVNIRYVLMSSYLSMFFRHKPFWEKLLAGCLLTDETFGIAAQEAKRGGAIRFFWLLGLNGAAYLNWIVANLAGAQLASSLPTSLTDGLNFSLTAMFIGLVLATYFASQSKSQELVTMIVAVTVIAAGQAWVDANVMVLVATLLAASAGVLATRLGWKQTELRR